MLKRILLIVALGVSFAPAAFADVGSLGYDICQKTKGENSQCQLSAAIGDGASQCERQKALDSMIADNVASGYKADGSSRALPTPN